MPDNTYFKWHSNLLQVTIKPNSSDTFDKEMIWFIYTTDQELINDIGEIYDTY